MGRGGGGRRGTRRQTDKKGGGGEERLKEREFCESLGNSLNVMRV